MKIKVAIANASGSELASEIIVAPDGLNADDHSHLIEDVIVAWTLSIGDTITIREVAP